MKNREELLAFIREWRQTGESLEILARDLWTKISEMTEDAWNMGRNSGISEERDSWLN